MLKFIQSPKFYMPTIYIISGILIYMFIAAEDVKPTDEQNSSNRALSFSSTRVVSVDKAIILPPLHSC